MKHDVRVPLNETPTAMHRLSATFTDPQERSIHFDERSQRPLDGLRILLVDDSEINLDVGRRMLERMGAQVTVTHDGVSALNMIQAASPSYDAVLMDVQMPGMDGLATTRRLRQHRDFERLPVIALTGGAPLQERRRVLAAGMDGLLAKPIDPAEMVRMVRGLIERVDDERGPPTHVDEVNATDLASPPWPRIEGIDSEHAASQLGHDIQLFRSSLAIFVRDVEALLSTDLADLAGLAGQPDTWDAAKRAELEAWIHKVRGGAAWLGAGEVKRLAGLAQASLVQSDAPLDQVLAPLWQAMTQLTDSIKRALAEMALPGRRAP